MRIVRLAGFGVLAVAAVGTFFVQPADPGADPRVVALLALLALVLIWHFATLRRSRRPASEDAAPPGPVEAPAPAPEDVVERDVPTAPAAPFLPGAIAPTEVLPPDAEVVAQGPAEDHFDLDAPVPGTPVADEPSAGSGPAHDAETVVEPAEPALPPPPPAPQYKDGFEKWAAEMFGQGSS